MEFFIFDVGHGFCAYLRADNGNGMLFDCGHDEAGFRPSRYFPQVGVRTIQNFILGNFDDDHVSDLPNLMRVVGIDVFTRNRSIQADVLRRIKLQGGPLSPGVTAMVDLHANYVYAYQEPDFAGIRTTFCHNDYPSFTDTNNLSLVSFVEYDGIGIIIPGDLEKAGWKALLQNASFRQRLAGVDIFIASHHGRESGYCEDVFAYCKPQIIIISDEEKQYETQETCYAKHALGIPWTSNGTKSTRYVVTTRNDGHTVIRKTAGQPYQITVYRTEIPVPEMSRAVGY